MLYPLRLDRSGTPSIQPIRYAKGFFIMLALLAFDAATRRLRFFDPRLALTVNFRLLDSRVAGMVIYILVTLKDSKNKVKITFS